MFTHMSSFWFMVVHKKKILVICADCGMGGPLCVMCWYSNLHSRVVMVILLSGYTFVRKKIPPPLSLNIKAPLPTPHPQIGGASWEGGPFLRYVLFYIYLFFKDYIYYYYICIWGGFDVRHVYKAWELLCDL